MAKRIEVKTLQDAWDMVNKFFPDDYEPDSDSIERAGYEIYRSVKEYYNYICNLGDRLEINLKEGNRTINIWIVPEETEKMTSYLPTKEDIKEAAAHQYTFEPETVQLIRIFVHGDIFASEASRRVYNSMRKVADDNYWLNSIASDVAVAYCEDKGIEWGCVKVISINHHDHDKNNYTGHYVIEAIVSPRIKE